jgi:hypothetical protein
MIEVGGTITFSVKLYDKDPNLDPTAALVNPLSVTLSILKPDDTTANPTITLPPSVTGVFTYKLPATLAGRYRFWCRKAFCYTDSRTGCDQCSSLLLLRSFLCSSVPEVDSRRNYLTSLWMVLLRWNFHRNL